MTFQKGKSGNPAGRPRGTSAAQKLRRAIECDLAEIIEAMVAAARGGDVSAAKLLLDRTIPALKPTDQAVQLPIVEGLAENSHVVLRAIGDGSVSPEQGAKLLQGLSSTARIEETAQLKDRLQAIERVLNSRGDIYA